MIQDSWKTHHFRKSASKVSSPAKAIQKSLLRKLARECHEMRDPISGEEFKKASIPYLQEIYEVGEVIPETGKRRCYGYDSLKELHHGQWTDPFTRKPWSEELWQSIESEKTRRRADRGVLQKARRRRRERREEARVTGEDLHNPWAWKPGVTKQQAGPIIARAWRLERYRAR
jgi:hypothetical protein